MDEEYTVFWSTDVQDNTPYIGGLYYRSDIKDFIQRVEADGDKKIVGIKVDDTYNLEFIYKQIGNIIRVDFGSEEE